MNFENDLEQNPNSYDDGHDSDLEARLYAEIHFSNNIIGEETNSTTNNQPADTPSSGFKKIDNDGPTEKVVNEPVQTQNSSANNGSNNSAVPPSIAIAQNESETNKNNKTSQKRSAVNDSDELNESNKKRKPSHNNESGSNKQVKEYVQPEDSNKIINPYNKNVSHTPAVGMQLLDKEFIDLLFGKRSNNKKKIKTTSKQAKQKKNVKQTNNKVQQQNKTQANTSRVVIENERTYTDVPMDKGIPQNSFLESSSVIDISSEDSTEDDSKYNTTIATDKKLGKKKAAVMESEDSLSDSEESIFEVPVPPKPAPPIIELKDSGSEVDSGSESDDDSSSSDSSISHKSMTQNKGDQSLNSTTATTDNEYNTDATINEPDNIVLNCTEIERGVSSLSEIKEMSQSSSKKQPSLNARDNTPDVEKQQSSSHSSDMCRSKEPQNQSNNSFRKEKVSSTSNKKQSESGRNSKTLSNEEYFFQPMNAAMKAFYNESWGGENFDMDKLKNKMSSDPKKWAILNDDIVASFVKRKRYFGMVCSRCHKDGHRQNQCTEIRKLPTCHMCGLTGHTEVSCPKKICLTCGQKQNMYRKTCENCRKISCSRCQSRGHLSHDCPDLWRRYHQTINKGNAEPPDNLRLIFKSRNELQCCNCARKGHVSAVCNKLRWSQHFPNPEHVTNYNGPAYFQDNEPSRNANDTIESSTNRSSICNSSFNIDNTVDSLINLDSRCEASSQNQSLATSPANTVREPGKPWSFEVKPKLIDESATLKTSTLMLDMRDKNALNDYGNWTYLVKFLNSLVAVTPAEFMMQQYGKQVKIRMKCIKKYQKHITQLIQQYASRNNNERSHMLMTCERRIFKVTNTLTEKLNELKDLNEDPIKLYEESKQLNWELMNKENRVLDSLDYSLKVSRLAHCQRKLLMTLYREGFLDDSLKKLRRIYKNLTTTKQYIKKPHKMMAFKNFFPYLHYFNNVFSPHEHSELNTAMRKFQEHSARCDRLKNNPLLFPQNHHGLSNESNQNVSSSNNIAALEMPSTSYIPPLLPNYTPAANRSQGRPKTTRETQRNSAEHLKYLKKHPRGLFLESVQNNKKGPKSKLTKKMNNFQEETKRLIDTAKELNLPHLHKHIDILQKKMQNEIYVYEKDVKLLQQHVNEELKRRGERRR
ncbi:uncharacterized protein LOC100678029 [Nasonia vitripennis]|uniref:Zinc finger CCHC domain-containing protein 7 n=1 Tax=Nasonia vitripennis TaxID=7425 RepID=A0A7M7QK47_NASVI|nr:uncharacterized protein LOC100678029 [Nasonia vitripennis]